MGSFKNIVVSEEYDGIEGSFDNLQKVLLMHKYLYYIKSSPIITDYEYDMLEKESYLLAQELGFRADPWEGPEEDEKHHVHWMVGFDPSHPLSNEVIEEVESEKA